LAVRFGDSGIFSAAKPFLRRIARCPKKRPPVIRLAIEIRRGQIPHNIRITARGKVDGGGAQVQAIMSALNFASASGIRYAHSPFVTIENFFEDPIAMAPRWESFFSLGHGEAKVDMQADRLVDLEKFLADRSLWSNPGVVVQAPHFHEFCDRWPTSYNRIVGSLRQKYARSDKSALVVHDIKKGVVISAHIRRIHSSPRVAARRNTDDEQILRTIAQAAEIAAGESLPVKVNVFSDADPASLNRFFDAGYEIHAGDDVFETFHNLVQTDVLITAKSSFSYVAGLLSEGVKLYEPFRHQPLPGWVRLRPDGSFETEGFRDALRLWFRKRKQQSTN
jgi:hypothetical protein